MQTPNLEDLSFHQPTENSFGEKEEKAPIYILTKKYFIPP
jgi:hypothetical protein